MTIKNIKFKELEKGYILVNYNTFKQLNPIVFDNISEFFNGFASIKLEGIGWNFIDTNGELVYNGDIWFDDVYNFSNGTAFVRKAGKGWYWLNTQGELIEHNSSIL